MNPVPFLRRAAAAAVCVSAIGMSGCKTAAPKPPEPITHVIRQHIYDRAWQPVGHVGLWKPDPAGHMEQAIYSAPLFLIQITEPVRNLSRIDVVWAFTNSIVLRDKTHLQQTFLWQPRGQKNLGGQLQAIRVTFDSEDRPAIWEVFRERSGAELIWISQAFEISAADQFGSPLPGRMSSAEQSFADAPRAIVPAIVDDGPMPMGPMLYMDAHGDVPVVACRCSAIQASTLEERGLYQLSWISSEKGRDRISAAAKNEFMIDWFDPHRLQKRLRLPADF
jgi:hypothetical protein